jgi:Tol biopolymer transport system component
MTRRFRISTLERNILSALAALLLIATAVPFAFAAAKAAARIVVIGTDDQLYVCSGDCAKAECLTCPVKGLQVRGPARIRRVSLNTQFEIPGMPPQGDQPQPESPIMRYGWPTFSPDGSRLAYSWGGHRADGNQFGISVFDFARHVEIPIFASRNERIDYVFWTPDSKSVSFLLGEPEGLSLMLAEVKEKEPVRLVLSGVPIYYDWNRTADRLVVHTNNDVNQSRTEHVTLMSISPTSQDALRTMSRGRLPFKTPCWSPDEKHLAYIENNNDESYLVVFDAGGDHPRSIASLPIGESSFVWAPDSQHIAYSSAVIGADSVLHGIRVVDIADAESKRISGEDVAAYFYSPDGKYLAVIAVPPDRPYYQWQLIEVKSGKMRKLDMFLATQEESVSYHYFDQLALSHTIWAPDSSEFVYAGVRLIHEPDAGGGPTPEPQLWIEPVDGRSPRSGPAGTLAFYSPAS